MRATTSRLLAQRRVPILGRIILGLHQRGCLYWLSVRVASDTPFVLDPKTSGTNAEPQAT